MAIHSLKSSVTAFAPATVANVACAFDVLGFAVDEPGDLVTVTRGTQAGVVVEEISGDYGRLPRDGERNTAAVAVRETLRLAGVTDFSISIRIKKMMPLGSGLGSSAASAVAAAVAVNALYGEPLERSQLLPAVIESERIACGAAHADNVAPSLLGGFVLIRSYSPIDTVKVAVPNELFATIIHPHIEIRTEDARRILKRDIPLKNAIIQWGNAAGLMVGLLTGDYGLIGRSLQDVVIEPDRALLIPGFETVKNAAIDAGALGAGISGSGPSVFALSQGKELALRAADAMTAAFSAAGIGSDRYISAINSEGARIVESQP